MPKPTLALILLLAQWGCGGEELINRDETESARLIVRLSSDLPPLAAPERIRKIATESGLDLGYLRPLAGGAHLLVVKWMPGSAQLESILAQLSRTKDVAHVEVDRRRKGY